MGRKVSCLQLVVEDTSADTALYLIVGQSPLTLSLNLSYFSLVGDPWHFGADPDPYLWLMDPDPTPFFIDFKDAKKIIFSYFFLITCPQAYHLQSKQFNFLLKFIVKILFCRHYFSPLNTFIRKREGSGSGSVPLTNGSGSGRPKNMRIRIPNTVF